MENQYEEQNYASNQEKKKKKNSPIILESL